MPHHRSTIALSVLSILAFASSTRATNGILGEWEAQYPTSTLLDRMTAQTGNRCLLCHSPDGMNEIGNCYREAILHLVEAGNSSWDAITLLDTEDSDGDGFTNGQEATMPYWHSPGHVGYNPGLIGSEGTDPCGTDPNAPVTGGPETPLDTAPVPTMSEWGVAIMALLVMAAGTLAFSARRQPAA